MKYKLKRMAAATLVVALSTNVAPISVYARSFNDINSQHWAYRHITSLASDGIVNGRDDGNFDPDATITRAEFITMINNTFGFTNESEIHFSDVNQDAWYAGQIRRAIAAGYVQGFEDGTLRPNNNITRAEATVILNNILGLPSAPLAQFEDTTEIPSWAQNAVNSVAAAEIIRGFPDGTFRPTNNMTRAESAVVLTNVRDNFLRQNLSNEDIVSDMGQEVVALGDAFTITSNHGTSEVQTIDGDVRIAGTTALEVRNLVINGDLVIAESQRSQLVSLSNVTVTGTVYIDSTNVHLLGEFNNVNVNQPNTRLRLRNSGGTTVQSLTVAETATGTRLSLDANTSIESAVINAARTSIVGNGRIANAAINAANVTVANASIIQNMTGSNQATVGGGAGNVGGGNIGGGGGGGGWTPGPPSPEVQPPIAAQGGPILINLYANGQLATNQARAIMDMLNDDLTVNGSPVIWNAGTYTFALTQGATLRIEVDNTRLVTSATVLGGTGLSTGQTTATITIPNSAISETLGINQRNVTVGATITRATGETTLPDDEDNDNDPIEDVNNDPIIANTTPIIVQFNHDGSLVSNQADSLAAALRTLTVGGDDIVWSSSTLRILNNSGAETGANLVITANNNGEITTATITGGNTLTQGANLTNVRVANSVVSGTPELGTRDIIINLNLQRAAADVTTDHKVEVNRDVVLHRPNNGSQGGFATVHDRDRFTESLRTAIGSVDGFTGFSGTSNIVIPLEDNDGSTITITLTNGAINQVSITAAAPLRGDIDEYTSVPVDFVIPYDRLVGFEEDENIIVSMNLRKQSAHTVNTSHPLALNGAGNNVVPNTLTAFIGALNTARSAANSYFNNWDTGTHTLHFVGHEGSYIEINAATAGTGFGITNINIESSLESEILAITPSRSLYVQLLMDGSTTSNPNVTENDFIIVNVRITSAGIATVDNTHPVAFNIRGNDFVTDARHNTFVTQLTTAIRTQISAGFSWEPITSPDYVALNFIDPANNQPIAGSHLMISGGAGGIRVESAQLSSALRDRIRSTPNQTLPLQILIPESAHTGDGDIRVNVTVTADGITTVAETNPIRLNAAGDNFTINDARNAFAGALTAALNTYVDAFGGWATMASASPQTIQFIDPANDQPIADSDLTVTSQYGGQGLTIASIRASEALLARINSAPVEGLPLQLLIPDAAYTSTDGIRHGYNQTTAGNIIVNVFVTSDSIATLTDHPIRLNADGDDFITTHARNAFAAYLDYELREQVDAFTGWANIASNATAPANQIGFRTTGGTTIAGAHLTMHGFGTNFNITGITTNAAFLAALDEGLQLVIPAAMVSNAAVTTDIIVNVPVTRETPTTVAEPIMFNAALTDFVSNSSFYDFSTDLSAAVINVMESRGVTLPAGSSLWAGGPLTFTFEGYTGYDPNAIDSTMTITSAGGNVFGAATVVATNIQTLLETEIGTTATDLSLRIPYTAINHGHIVDDIVVNITIASPAPLITVGTTMALEDTLNNIINTESQRDNFAVALTQALRASTATSDFNSWAGSSGSPVTSRFYFVEAPLAHINVSSIGDENLTITNVNRVSDNPLSVGSLAHALNNLAADGTATRNLHLRIPATAVRSSDVTRDIIVRVTATRGVIDPTSGSHNNIILQIGDLEIELPLDEIDPDIIDQGNEGDSDYDYTKDDNYEKYENEEDLDEPNLDESNPDKSNPDDSNPDESGSDLGDNNN